MRIVHESYDALILRESATTLRAIGGTLGLAGIVMAASGILASGPVALIIIGSVMAALGALFGLLPATHTFAFSRSERRLVIVRRRLGRATREEYPLRDVADADVEESKSSDSGSTWRVVVKLADGQVIPVTTYYTSGYEAKKRAADRMRGFLVQAGFRDVDAARVPKAAPVYNLKNLTRRQKLAGTAFIMLFGLVFGGIGGTIMAKEHQRLTTWVPVQATVLSTRVESHSDDDGTTYSPVVVYRYYVNNQPYTSSRVLPMNESRSGGWARNIVGEYDVNAQYTAWYNPADPEEAFLRRSRSLVAPIFAGVGALLFFVAFLVRRAASANAT